MNEQTMDAPESAPFTITETVEPIRYMDANGDWHEGAPATPKHEQAAEDQIVD